MDKIFAVIIFLVMFVFIMTEKFPRHIVTLCGAAAVLVIVFGICMRSPSDAMRAINVDCFFHTGFWYGTSETSSGINWSTIVFVAGMMIMVEGMAMGGIFQWLCLKIAGWVKYRTVPLLVCFMLVSAVLSMFIDSITVMLFLAAVTAELGALLHFDPVPMILSEIFCANLGGSATMCGDPPNIIIGTSLGYSFSDFITNTGVIAAICLVFSVLYFYFSFRRELAESEKNRPQNIHYPEASSAIDNKRTFTGCMAVFLVVVVLLITHAQTGLTVATIGIIAALATTAVVAATVNGRSALMLFKRMDYRTLLFFIGLFVVVSGLEQTGCLEVLAGLIAKVSGGSVAIMLAVILWLSAVASAFIDNIPFAATMVPVIESMAATQGIPLTTLAWTLSLGTDLGGSATPIGASANVVGTSVAAQNGHPISWGKYCRYCAPATVIAVGVSMVCIFVRYL